MFPVDVGGSCLSMQLPPSSLYRLRFVRPEGQLVRDGRLLSTDKQRRLISMCS